MSHSSPIDNAAALRERVRALVIDVLSRLEQGSTDKPSVLTQAPAVDAKTGADTRRLLLVYCSSSQVPSDSTSQVASLAQQGWSFSAVFSQTFAKTHNVSAILGSLPKGTEVVAAEDENAVLKAAKACRGVILPALCLNTAAKAALAIADSAPTIAIQQALLLGRTVFVARDIATLGATLSTEFPALPPALLRVAEDHFHKLQAMGAVFSAPERLAKAVSEAFAEPVNETPERLARTKPSPKRHFVTQEDVWAARSKGRTELTYPRNAIVTDAAREYASQYGITLREE